jgi:S1-C subfamily serine protease
VRRAAAATAAALLLLAAGCDVNGDSDDGDGQSAGPNEVTTTRVQVVEGLGENGGFDPAAIYDRLSPGVVTILSIFGGGTGLLEDGGEGGQGSGFVIDGDGYIATNAHVVTTERGDSTGSSSSSPTGTGCRRRSSDTTRAPTWRCSRSIRRACR